MDWHDNAQEDEDARQAVEKAFTLVAEGPALHFSRQPKQRGGAEGSSFGSREHRLEAHPPLFAGEGEAARLARADASAACRAALAANIQETLDATDAGVFQQLLDFCQQSHPGPAAATAGAGAGAGGDIRRVPTGLVLAGGVNSADHCHTFPRLVSFLRAAGCYVALLQPASMGRVPGDALGEILRQFAGLAESAAEHWDALAEWYRAGTAGAQAAAEVANGDSDDEQQAEAEGGRHEARRKRQRGAARGTAADAAAAAEAAERAARPLVVVVEGTEGVDARCLRELVGLASERHREVPLTLVLGLTTTDKALAEMLPSEVLDRCMEPRSFKLATAIARLDSLVQQVLLGGSGRWPGLLFSQKIWCQLTDDFLNHYYSAGSITFGLKVAAQAHFFSQPLSCLAAAALEGRQALGEAAAKLDAKTLAEAKRKLRCRSAADVARVVDEAQAGWSRWAVGMHWLLLAAEAAGLRAQEFRPWRLLEAALLQDFATGGGRGQLKQLLGRIEPPLRGLDAQAAASLAEALQQRAAAVWGGADAAADELQGLEAALAAAAAAADGEDQEQRSGSANAAAPVQAQAAAGGKQQKAKKKEKYHSKESRKAALVKKTAEAAEAPKGGTAAAAGKKARKAAAPGARLAAWLAPALRTLLDTPPTKLPGSVVFTCRDAASLACTTAEPRSALHAALTEPHLLLPGLPEDMGTSAAQEDACLAYTLFDQDPSCANLADWYQAFAAVHGQGGADEERGEEGAAGGGKKRKKAAVKKAGGKKGGGSAEGGGEAAKQREVAARFSQATAELQFVGLIRPAKRRRGDWAQRMIHMPAAGC